MKTNFLALAGLGVVLTITPLQLRADQDGADPRLSGAPGEATCTSCHGTGSANINGGNVAVSMDGGTTYVPGQKQRVTVTITDSTARRWGFEASPRLSSSGTTLAGSMATADSFTQIKRAGTLQWITHTLTGTRAGTANSIQFQFDWTPPATDSGAVDFYVAANAANNNSRDDSGDHVYTTKFTVTPASATSSNKPAVSQGGLGNSFSGLATRLAPGTWAGLYGTNLSSSTRQWAGSDFQGNQGPTSLDGVTVTVNGKAAALNYVSPTQVNIQIPTDAGTGTSSVVVTNSNGSSDSYSVNLSQFAPGLNANAAFSANGKQYVVAQFADGTFVGPTGLISGVNFRPAKAGDTITIFGVGFGPLQTAANTGQIVTGTNPTANAVTFRLGSVTVTPAYAGAAPGFVGAYQFNLVIPANAGTGDVAIDSTVGGVSTGQTLYLTLQ